MSFSQEIAFMSLQNVRPKWHQFRIKGLLLLMLLLALVFGAWRSVILPHWMQGPAIKIFRDKGAEVACKSTERTWVTDFLGGTPETPTRISFPLLPSDDHFIPGLNVSRISGPPQKNGMRHWSVGREAFSYLPWLSELEVLELSTTDVSNADLYRISGLSRLRILDISASNITDEGLRGLGNLKSLQVIRLPEAITDQGLRYLQQLPIVEELDLSGTDITDQGLAYLAEWKSLKKLSLKHTSVTDEGLTALMQLKQLEQLEIFGSHITEEGFSELKKRVPSVGSDIEELKSRLEVFQRVREQIGQQSGNQD